MIRVLAVKVSVAAIVIAGSLAHAAGAVPGTKELSGPSEAVTPEIVEAIATEVKRAMDSLRVPGEPPPYIISHKVTEVEVNNTVASLGSTTWQKDNHFVSLETRVHVGDYQLDNTNFVMANAESVDGVSARSLPLEATPSIARQAAWLATDEAYKEALDQMRAKRDARRGAGAAVSRPSYARQKPVVQEQPVLVPALESVEALAQRAQSISRVFRKTPHIRDSRVAFTSFLERRWYINSEGTNAHDTRRVTGIIIAATSQAQDGQELALYYSRYGHTAADLPGDAELMREAEAIKRDLQALRTAPVMENYTGPVLFEGVGAAGMVRNTLAPHLGGTPLPEGLAASEAKQFGGALADRVGLRVLAPILSLVDDPKTHRAGKRGLIGGYRIDDEGVPAQRVTVIKDGVLKSLLNSRTPAKAGQVSNGHARRTTLGGVFHGSATNLFVNAKRGLSRAQLKRKLIAEARAQGLPYGLIMRRFDDSAVTAAPESTYWEMLQLINTSDRQRPPPSLLAYKVYLNGKEELVRGVQLHPVPIRAWRDVIAAGRKATVFNYLASTNNYLWHKINSTRSGEVPSAGIESAVVTPDLLFKELDVDGRVVGARSLPLVPPPSVSKTGP